jgi:hypothetical protein
MLKRSVLLFLAVSAIQASENGEKNDKIGEKFKSYEELYVVAKRAYLDNDWTNCVKYMNLALGDYKLQQNVVIQCQRMCRKKLEDAKPLVDSISADGGGGGGGGGVEEADLMFYERITHNTLCLMRCKRAAFNGTRIEQVSPDVRGEFEKKKPYDYLQLCHHQVGNIIQYVGRCFLNAKLVPFS